MSSMNAHALFLGASKSDSFHQAIMLPVEKRKALLNADRRLRTAIRRASLEAIRFGNQMALATDAYKASKQVPPTLDVRFLLQGGLAYDTAVEPAIVPPQQSDRDTGIYVKTSFLANQEPGLASNKFFELVENAIKSLCDAEGWTIKKKSTCVRVELSPCMHIDYPLYAIPDDAFETLEKSICDATGQTLITASSQMLTLLNRHRTLRIPSDRIMLAHREEGWVQSDPRALHDWFEEQFSRYGPQVRRQSRYFKGWRDFAFEKGGPSSVALMVCIANCYREGLVSANEMRDDLAFHQIAGALSKLMRDPIQNPVLDAPSTLNDWDDIERSRYRSAADDLHKAVGAALNGHYLQELTVQRLQNALGQRVPNRPDLV
ncbi:MAG: CBASS cGAMP synthase, partial [Pseudomonadota bacterium]